MIDISEAQLDPFRAFHYFHEEINIHIKVTLSAALVLVRETGAPSDTDGLAELIKQAHPAWNTPPIRGLSIPTQRELHRAVASFALVSIFSAFDDFLSGTEAELSRFSSRSAVVVERPAETASTEQEQDESAADDDSAEKLINFYRRYGWRTVAIDGLLPLLRYFRLCRNCIAHRSSRASRALSEQSEDEGVQNAAKPRLDRNSKELPRFGVNSEVFLAPTHAILCSHILRTIAEDCNKKLIETLGLDGFVRAVAHHTMFGDRIVRSEAYRTPEAVFNFAATDRYRARLGSRGDSVAEMKRLGIWKDYLLTFERKYVA